MTGPTTLMRNIRLFTTTGALALVTLLATVPASAANASQAPSSTITYTVPGDRLFLEGVDTIGNTFYTTSLGNGAVFRGQLGDTDSAEVFLPAGADGRTSANGIKATDKLLIVAGGTTGKLFIYDRQSAKLLAIHTVSGSGDTFVNDVTLTPKGDLYVTDSSRDVVYRVDKTDITRNSTLQVFSSFAGVDPKGAFNANGVIAVSQQYLVVVQTDTGNLYRVATKDGSISRINTGGATVTGGDGLEVKGRTLYVVRNAAAIITELKLAGNLVSGQVVSERTDPSFRFPTTASLHDGRLLIVNGQLDKLGGGSLEPFTLTDLKIA
ncbi:SMP-30/gluconolactonase/LRE family protein [Streptomyces canus]|uniref:SMP-30/gluconolactonase/LRE family protein n=1 Tax=Streptomyces canus TaxID=58343 RepID=UPI003816FB44